MLWLIYDTMNIQNVLLWLECTHGEVCRKSVPSVSLQLTHQSDAISCHSHPALFHCPRFCNEVYWGQGCSAARDLEVHTGLLHYCTFGLEAVNDAQNVREDTTRKKITSSRVYQNDNVILQHI